MHLSELRFFIESLVLVAPESICRRGEQDSCEHLASRCGYWGKVTGETAQPVPALSVQASVIPLGRAHALQSHGMNCKYASPPPPTNFKHTITADTRGLKHVHLIFKRAENRRKCLGCFCLYHSCCNQVSRFFSEL